MKARLRGWIAPLRAGTTRARNALLRWGWIRVAPLDTSHRWVTTPPSLAGRCVCVLATYSADGAISTHTRFLLRRWRERGFDVVFVVATDQVESIAVDAAAFPDCRGILVRPNSGYDFGSWATALNARPDLRDAALLALANDSLYGPFDGFDALIDRVVASPADLVAMTDSYEYRHHVQSFLLFYKPHALRSAAFERFWTGVEGGDREATIQRCEIPQLKAMKDAAMRVEILFPSERGARDSNPTLCQWRALVERGFPFVKVQLLRENPFGADLAGWDRLLREHGYDPSLVREHLGARYASSAARFAETTP